MYLAIFTWLVDRLRPTLPDALLKLSPSAIIHARNTRVNNNTLSLVFILIKACCNTTEVDDDQRNAENAVNDFSFNPVFIYNVCKEWNQIYFIGDKLPTCWISHVIMEIWESQG